MVDWLIIANIYIYITETNALPGLGSRIRTLDSEMNQEKQMMEEDGREKSKEAIKSIWEEHCQENVEAVKPTLKELECLQKFRDDHESNFIINNVRFNNRSDQIRREIERLNEKIAEEISDYRNLQDSEFIDYENDEFMIGHEDSVALYSWMKEKLLEKWKTNLELQEKKFKQYLTHGVFYFHQCGNRQLNLEDPGKLDVSELMFEQVKPTAEHELHPGKCEYKIQMKFDSPPSSREDSSEEDNTDESDE